MTLLQFQSLSGDLQRQVVQQKGVFLLGRTGVGVTVKLYQVERFYVELFFAPKMSQVTHVTCFEDTALLESYLHQVDVSDLQALLH